MLVKASSPVPNQDMPIQYISVESSSKDKKKLRTTKFRPHEEFRYYTYNFFEKTRQCIWLNSHISKKPPNSWKVKAISLLSSLLGGRSMTLRWFTFHCCAKCSNLWNTSGVFSPPPPLQALGWAWSCASFKTNTIRYGECFSLTKIKLIVPSLLPSTQVLHRSKWFGGGNLAENSRWIMYQMICFSQDKPMESNLIWYIKPAIQMSERLPLVSIQSPRISLSDSSGSLFCRKSSSIPSMKLPSFENATKGRETLFFG